MKSKLTSNGSVSNEASAKHAHAHSCEIDASTEEGTHRAQCPQGSATMIARSRRQLMQSFGPCAINTLPIVRRVR